MRFHHPRSAASLLFCIFIALSISTAAHAGPGVEAETSNGGSIWGKNYFPNVTLTTHEGKEVRFFDDLIKDKVVVINFIYTSCPDACPLETARLAEVQGILGDRVGEDVFMYSITIDPERDTVSALAEYRERYQAEKGWTFLRGSDKDVTLLRRKLGLYIDDIDQEAGDHNLSLIIGNQSTGRWQKASPFENPYILATQIGQWLSNHSKAREKKNAYEDAPELRNIGDGETLFRTRCQVCHAIGSTTEADLKPRVGPNLLGVTERREKEWLERWLREPDVMLAEEDSIAMGLFYAYNQVPMPNMRLSQTQVGQLLDYIKTEENRVAKHEQLLAVLPKKDANVESCCQKDEAGVLSSVVAATDPAKTQMGGSCCDEELASAAGCEKTGATVCPCEKGAVGDGSKSAPSMLWSGLGVVLGGIAMVLRRRAL